MRDEKMLEKLVTHEVKDISELFNLVDNCARAVEGRAWHSHPTLEVGKANKPEVDATAQSSGKNKSTKKKSSNNKPLKEALTATALAIKVCEGCGPCGDK
jgi:hypothetical protein